MDSTHRIKCLLLVCDVLNLSDRVISLPKTNTVLNISPFVHQALVLICLNLLLAILFLLSPESETHYTRPWKSPSLPSYATPFFFCIAKYVSSSASCLLSFSFSYSVLNSSEPEGSTKPCSWLLLQCFFEQQTAIKEEQQEQQEYEQQQEAKSLQPERCSIHCANSLGFRVAIPSTSPCMISYLHRLLCGVSVFLPPNLKYKAIFGFENHSKFSQLLWIVFKSHNSLNSKKQSIKSEDLRCWIGSQCFPQQ